MRRSILSVVALAVLASFPAAAAPPATDAWAPVRFLVGTWTGTGGGEGPGQGVGTTSFQWDLEQKILVRRDHTEFSKTAERPAASHDALMILYPQGGALHGSYFDAAGHVIPYTLVAGTAAGTAQFLSDAGPGPRFRLTYQQDKSGDVAITFEMGPPNATDGFRPVTTGTVHKKADK